MTARRCQIVGLLFRNSMKRTCGQSGGRNLTNFRTANFESSQKKCFHTGKSSAQSKVQEVGQFEPIKIEGNYDTGQLFLHRVFGYRGVLLFPWAAKVFDRDQQTTKAGEKFDSTKPSPKSKGARNDPTKPKDSKISTMSYYQVLIDDRDQPFIKHRNLPESVTFLRNGDPSEKNRSLYAISGLDYVAHEDIIPYKSKDKVPIHHELFDKFLGPVASSTPEGDQDVVFEAQTTLLKWQENNHPWLELSDVHKETSDKIRVTVIPFYMGVRESQGTHWWRYSIRLENLGEQAVTLRERNWRIFSLSGTLETVRGRGVVGHEPILNQEQPAFQYSSHVSLQAPSGHMWGTFRMEREDGYSFECRIPPFALESKQDDPDDPAIIGN